MLDYLAIHASTLGLGRILRMYADIPKNEFGLPTLGYLHMKASTLGLDVFCVRTQVFQIWIIGVYEQVPRGICVFCVRTQVFLKIILAFQRWIICAYEQVHRDMCVFLCTYTDIPKKGCVVAQIIQSWETFFKLPNMTIRNFYACT